jgi:hypothetical protein
MKQTQKRTTQWKLTPVFEVVARCPRTVADVKSGEQLPLFYGPSRPMNCPCTFPSSRRRSMAYLRGPDGDSNVNP